MALLTVWFTIFLYTFAFYHINNGIIAYKGNENNSSRL